MYPKLCGPNDSLRGGTNGYPQVDLYGLHYTSGVMRALVYTAPVTTVLQEATRATPKDNEVEIAVGVAGVCGSDITGFLGHSARRKPPLILGHELVGWLEDGTRVVANPLISCGRCEACLSGHQNLCGSWKLLGLDQTQGTFAEYVVLPRSQVYPIPAELDQRRAILAEPLANVMHLFRLLRPQPFFRLAIVGAGTMGALALLVAAKLGARHRTVVDLNQERLLIMQAMGAEHTINTGSADGIAHAKEIAGAGFDVVLDASGHSSARRLAFELCRPGGEVVLLGMGQPSSEIDFLTSIRKEHRVTMSFAYTPVDFQRSLDLLIAGEIDLSQWTAVVPLEQGQHALETIAHHPGSLLKMVLSVADQPRFGQR
jgi:2-desacetyl-2-hydroxyethyl bacteriochlorophyllide A dehydrogenase